MKQIKNIDMSFLTDSFPEAKAGIVIKKSHRGLLHKDLHVPKGEKIPASKLAIKSTDSKAVKKRKQFAINFRHAEVGIQLDTVRTPESTVDQPYKKLTTEEIMQSMQNKLSPYLQQHQNPLIPSLNAANDNGSKWAGSELPDVSVTSTRRNQRPVAPDTIDQSTEGTYGTKNNETFVGRGLNLQNTLVPNVHKPNKLQQNVATALSVVDSFIPQDKIKSLYQRPEDEQSVNPFPYGKGSQAIMKNGGNITPDEAKQFLTNGIKGKPLTPQQQKYFSGIAGIMKMGGKMKKCDEGGVLPNPDDPKSKKKVSKDGTPMIDMQEELAAYNTGKRGGWSPDEMKRQLATFNRKTYLDQIDAAGYQPIPTALEQPILQSQLQQAPQHIQNKQPLLQQQNPYLAISPTGQQGFADKNKWMEYIAAMKSTGNNPNTVTEYGPNTGQASFNRFDDGGKVQPTRFVAFPYGDPNGMQSTYTLDLASKVKTGNGFMYNALGADGTQRTFNQNEIPQEYLNNPKNNYGLDNFNSKGKKQSTDSLFLAPGAHSMDINLPKHFNGGVAGMSGNMYGRFEHELAANGTMIPYGYEEGKEYDLDEQEIENLKRKGYKLQY